MGRSCAATSRSRSSPISTAAPPASSRHRCTRDSACRCSRRWPAGHRSSPCPMPLSSRSRATRPSWSTRPGSAMAFAWRSPGGSSSTGRDRARPRLLLAELRRAYARRLPGGAPAMSISAVVVSHGHAAELERSLPALVAQVDEIVVVANLPGSVGSPPAGVRVIENPRPLHLAENVNLGIAADDGGSRALRQSRRGGGAGRGRRARLSAGGAPPLRHRRAPDALAGRHVAAVATQLPHGHGHARPPHTPAQGLSALRAPARPLPARRAAHGPRAGRLDARRVPAPAPGDARARSAAGTPATGTTSRTSTSATGRCGQAGSGGMCRPRSSATRTPP